MSLRDKPTNAMDSSWRPRHDETIRYPKELTDRELFGLSLSKLSKGLSLTTSSRTTMVVYLRWLEVHRKSPSDLSNHWGNTVHQWGQSLRSRGFKEHEVNREVEIWKDDKGPFSKIDGRHPPVSSDIYKAFHEPLNGGKPGERKADHSGGSYWRRDGPLLDLRSKQPSHSHQEKKSRSEPFREPLKKKTPEMFLGAPPANYVCNRCGKKGHHLQACPTNMDPAYDKPPDSKYVCAVCDARGQHYKSLCPKNPDPYSIIQRRKAQGFKTPSKVTVTESWKQDNRTREALSMLRQKDRENARLSMEPESSNPSLRGQLTPTSAEKRAKLQKLDSLTLQLEREESDDMAQSGYAGKLVIDNTMHESRNRKRALTISSSLSPAELDGPAERNKLRKTGANAEDLRKPRAPMESKDILMFDTSEEVEKLLRLESYGPRSKAPYTINANLDEIIISNDSESDRGGRMDTSTPDAPMSEATAFDLFDYYSSSASNSESEMPSNNLALKPTIVQTNKKYSSFVERLLEKREEMMEIVHVIKKRPNAVKMWKKANKQQPQLTITESRQASPRRIESPQKQDGVAQSPVRATKAHVQAKIIQLDGAGDERPAACNTNHGIRKYKFSNIGRGAIGKVKNAARDFPTLKHRSSSQIQRLADQSQSEPLISRSPTPPSPCPKDDVKVLAQRSANTPRLLVTSLPAQLYDKDLPQLPSAKKLTLQPGDSCTSLPIFDFKSPSRKENKKPLHSHSAFSRKASSRSSAFSTFNEARSPKEFQSIVRKVIEEGKTGELKENARPKVARAMSENPLTQEKNLGKNELMQMPTAFQTHRDDKQKHVEFYKAGLVKDNDRETTVQSLKNFGNNFVLKTPVPEDIATMFQPGAQKSGMRPSPFSANTFVGKKHEHIGFVDQKRPSEKDRENETNALKKFGAQFKLITPMPLDLVDLVSRPTTKQEAEEKKEKDDRDVGIAGDTMME